MDIASQAARGYRAVQRQTESARGVEAKLFAEVTAALVGAHRAGREGFRDMAAALHDNRMLWDALLVDLSLESNGLPETLKIQLIELGHFVRSHSPRVLRGEDDAQPLIDINHAILAGLRRGPDGSIDRDRS